MPINSWISLTSKSKSTTVRRQPRSLRSSKSSSLFEVLVCNGLKWPWLAFCANKHLSNRAVVSSPSNKEIQDILRDWWAFLLKQSRNFVVNCILKFWKHRWRFQFNGWKVTLLLQKNLLFQLITWTFFFKRLIFCFLAVNIHNNLPVLNEQRISNERYNEEEFLVIDTKKNNLH